MRFLGLVFAVCVLAARAQGQETPEAQAFNAAVRSFESGFFERSEREFADFVNAYPEAPQFAEAILYQARSAMRQQKVKPALDLLQRHAEKAGLLADRFRYWIAEANLSRSNYVVAADEFARLVRDFPAAPRLLEASYGEARARFFLRDWPGVIRLLTDTNGAFQRASAARGSDEISTRGRLLLGEALVEQGELGAAEWEATHLAEDQITPEFKWRRRYLLCRIQLADQRFRAALASTTNLLSLAVATGQRELMAESVAMQSQVLERLDDLDAAMAVLAANLAPAVPAEPRRLAFLKTIELTLAQDRPLDAARQLETLFAQYPQDAVSDVALLTLGEIHLKQALAGDGDAVTNLSTNIVVGATNHVQAALGFFEKLLREFTNSPLLGKAWLDQGWCKWLDDQVGESARAFGRALELLPVGTDAALARFKLADAQFRQGDLTNALQNYRAMIKGYATWPRVQERWLDQALYQTVRVGLALPSKTVAQEALRQLLRDFPGRPLTERAMLLVGQAWLDAGEFEEARGLLAEFPRRFKQSALLPEAELLVARSFMAQGRWESAGGRYAAWLERFGTNALRADAAYNLALANYRSGAATNALGLFTNFLAQFPTHPMLAPRAQFWIAGFYYDQRDFTNAEANYQIVFQNTNWPLTNLTYEARMMAGRSAFARSGWKDAADHFRGVVNDDAAPSNLVAEALFALGDTLAMQDPDPAHPFQRFEDARVAFGKIPLLYPSSPLVPRAWGRTGDCLFQLARTDAKYYDAASEAYQKVLTAEPAPDVDARGLAEIGLGQVAERQAAQRRGPESIALLKSALDHYLNVVLGKILRTGETLDPALLKEAGLAAARLAEDLKQWESALHIYSRLLPALPPLRAVLEKRIERVRELMVSTAL